MNRRDFLAASVGAAATVVGLPTLEAVEAGVTPTALFKPLPLLVYQNIANAVPGAFKPTRSYRGLVR